MVEATQLTLPPTPLRFLEAVHAQGGYLPLNISIEHHLKILFFAQRADGTLLQFSRPFDRAVDALFTEVVAAAG